MAPAESRGARASFTACLQCTQHCPSFFSLVPSSPHSLPIPAAFLAGRGIRVDCQSAEDEPLHSEVQLEGPSGEIWNVSMQGQTLGSLAFTKGWAEFVTDHGLSVGDLLLFKLLSRSFFSVTVYGHDGCEKNDLFTVQNSQARLMANANESQKRPAADKELDCKSADVGNKRRKVGFDKPNTPFIIDIDEDEDQEDDLIILSCLESGNDKQTTDKSTVPLIMETGSHPQVNSSKVNIKTLKEESNNSSKQESLSSDESSDEDYDTLHTRINTVEKSLLKKIDDTHSLDLSTKHDRLEAFLAKDYTTEAFISKRRPVSDEERQIALLAAKKFKSNRPHLLKLMKQSHVYRGFWLGLDTDFSVQYLPSQIQEVALLDTSGKSWSARWLGARNGLSGGWRKFSLDHGLEEGDVCVFELLDSKKIVFKVHIFRVVPLRIEIPGRAHYLRKPPGKASCGYSFRKPAPSFSRCKGGQSSSRVKKMRGANASKNMRNAAEDTSCVPIAPTRETKRDNLRLHHLGSGVARALFWVGTTGGQRVAFSRKEKKKLARRCTDGAIDVLPPHEHAARNAVTELVPLPRHLTVGERSSRDLPSSFDGCQNLLKCVFFVFPTAGLAVA
ncbi:hypothetical protein L7F22_064722 [Adiantum nelumboides]|nr:hypothetical protein [Adiantum nelumboides]